MASAVVVVVVSGDVVVVVVSVGVEIIQRKGQIFTLIATYGLYIKKSATIVFCL